MHTSLPPPVGPGDRVGVAALSGPVDPARLEQGLDELRALGFEPVRARNLSSRAGLFAGGDAERLAAFHELAADAGLAAIFFARGGHGLLRILPAIDWELLALHPRAYVGYSDLTPFLLQVVSRLGLASFHGPMVAADFARGLDDAERGSLLAALAGDGPAELAGGAGDAGDGAGVAEGPLLGGCLSLLVATLGTPWAPDLSGSIWFWEDVGEPLYKLDRMLTHLGLSGSLAGIRGVVIGQVSGVEDEPELARAALESVREHLPGVPILSGIEAGHARPNLTLPLGRRARIEVASARLLVEIA